MFGKAEKSEMDKSFELLAQRVEIYEELSREMLDKLDNAVNKISETNNNIAAILAKHEERIEQCNKSDEGLLEYIKDIKERIKTLEEKMGDFYKFRWMTIGVASAAIVIIGSAQFFGDLLTVGDRGVTIEERIEQTR